MKNRIKLFISSILAGICIGFGSLLFILAKTYAGEAGLLLGACFFPIGLITICLCKLHLYTGKVGIIFRETTNTNSLSKSEWLLNILIGNCLGAAIIGLIIYGFTFIDTSSDFTNMVNIIGSTKSITFTFMSMFEILLKSFVCGIFVYLAVRFFNKGKTLLAKIFGIFVPIMIFVYFGFQHCIANVTYLIAAASYSFESFIGMLLCIIGNSFGALFVDKLID